MDADERSSSQASDPNHKSQFINHKSEGRPSIQGPCCVSRDGILGARDAQESRNSLRGKE
jgi:hypothetical protein